MATLHILDRWIRRRRVYCHPSVLWRNAIPIHGRERHPRFGRGDLQWHERWWDSSTTTANKLRISSWTFFWFFVLNSWTFDSNWFPGELQRVFIVTKSTGINYLIDSDSSGEIFLEIICIACGIITKVTVFKWQNRMKINCNRFELVDSLINWLHKEICLFRSLFDTYL